MTHEELDKLEAELTNEVNRRVGLGGYSTDAEGILLLNQSMLKMIQALKLIQRQLGKAKK